MRPNTLTILGATGFTGRLAVEYLNERYGSDLAYVVTARSAAKLEELKPLMANSPKATAMLCDVTDPESLDSVVKNSVCVVNFAGTPFIDKALPVVEACARHGTHYCDITGEIPLHRASYDRYNAAAAESGAIILHQCGYDSVPADITAFMAQKAMRERHGCGVAELRMYPGDSAGGVSGGTLATGAFLMSNKDLPGMAEVKARGAYALDPAGATGGPDKSMDGRESKLVSYDELAGTWTMPFIMAPVNVPLVRKSAALLGYGDSCRISEAQPCKSRLSAIASVAALGVGGLLFVLPPTRWMLFKTGVLPSPGSGPDRATRENGFFHEYAIAVGAKSPAPKITAHMRSGDAGDGGYKATARMACEAALTTALQRSDCRAEGGVLTPAAALGDAYVDRLNRSGMELTVEP
mmetsp:Transcript_37397/g.120207  ORF Transcript_37397/g.120207 Transcript_37397/m.120207 type:complete len:409 (-) Transcript_37397:579-1805(-)|eukprot:scaffold3393_cov101-Isochrysis_galbana.AAC.5